MRLAHANVALAQGVGDAALQRAVRHNVAQIRALLDERLGHRSTDPGQYDLRPKQAHRPRRLQEDARDMGVDDTDAGNIDDRGLGTEPCHAFQQNLEQLFGAAGVDVADERHHDHALSQGNQGSIELAQGELLRFAWKLVDGIDVAELEVQGLGGGRGGIQLRPPRVLGSSSPMYDGW